MTKKDLRRIEKLSDAMKDVLIKKARDTVCISAKPPNGMPYSNTGVTSNPTAVCAMRAYEQNDMFVSLYHQLADIINEEPDAKMRAILVYKYVELLSWSRIAKQMESSSAAVRKYFNRHIHCS